MKRCFGLRRCTWRGEPAFKSYAWSTSPLRRYTDLVNQWQIIAAARHGRTAALAAPFKPKDAALFSIISGLVSGLADGGAG